MKSEREKREALLLLLLLHVGGLFGHFRKTFGRARRRNVFIRQVGTGKEEEEEEAKSEETPESAASIEMNFATFAKTSHP